MGDYSVTTHYVAKLMVTSHECWILWIFVLYSFPIHDYHHNYHLKHLLYHKCLV